MPEMAGLRRWLESGWYTRPPRPLLRPLAALHARVIALRRQLYARGWLRSSHPGVPTVVVGNLTVGGTGKTPLVLWLAGQLRACGVKPGIVLRGYGGTQRGARLLDGSEAAREVGDEAVLLARRSGCPVAVGACRVQAARLLVERGCDMLLADDGLQHLALHRDVSIVVVDGARGLGNGALLPAGPLREPAARLAAADVVVLHGRDAHQVLPAGLATVSMELAPQALRALADDRELPLDGLRGEVVHAVAGIGHPARFFALLRALGATPLEHPFADHHRYVARDLDLGGHRIVMTEKDAVKCRELAAGRDDVYYLPVTAALPEADAQWLLGRVLAPRRN